MHIIKLNATPSTNSYLKELCSNKLLNDYTVVVTETQISGRGQMGTHWVSETGKNLTASVFVDVSYLNLKDHFFISIAVSLAIVKTLNQFSIPRVRIKWPNDILSENKKICGILIENIIKQNNLKSTIIGFGLNVNQTEFKDLPQAFSLKKITGIHYNLDELLLGIITNLKAYLKILKQQELKYLKTEYEGYLFRKGKPSTFRDSENNSFSGIIKTVTQNGKLQVLLEDKELREFNFKEITLLY